MSKKALPKGVVIAIALSTLLVMVMYFLLPTKDDDQKAVEKSRALNFETISIPVILKEARAELTEEERILFSDLENHAEDDSVRVANLKDLSRAWFERGKWILAGHYAEKVGEIEEKAEAWGIAGSTFALGMQRYKDPAKAEFSKKKAVLNYERAVSLSPDEVEYQVNLAVCYAEKPDQDNPMRGIMMLLDLDKKNPDNPKVLNTLAYYGLQTGQVDKAQGRLERVLGMDPDNRRANCLMARLLKDKGEIDKSITFQEKCDN